MCFLVIFLAAICSAGAAVPRDLELALKGFRSDVPPGWSFTQTTSAEGKSTVERSDAGKPEFDRWTLALKDGRAPAAGDLRDYGDARSRRSRGGTAPRLVDQLDLGSLETVSGDDVRVTYHCRLRPGETGDKTAAFLRATLVVHKVTHTIEVIELASTSRFSPGFGVSIAELLTRMTYSLPTEGRPSFPQQVATRVRGTAFFFKSLDAEMTVTFGDFIQPVKRTRAASP
jgi:hypothetical protein